MTSATALSSATPRQIWQRYTDVTHWPQWDHGTTQSSINGDFAVGTHGELQPVGGPALPFEIIWVVPEGGFADRTALGPATRLTFRHVLTATESGTQITHVIELDGPGASQMAAAMGAQLEQGLREAVASLAIVAAQGE